MATDTNKHTTSKSTFAKSMKHVAKTAPQTRRAQERYRAAAKAAGRSLPKIG